MEAKFGVDISRWNGNFNFDAAIDEGVEFVILKGGGGDQGLYTDSCFVRNYAEAKQRNIPVGVYWFSRATNVAEAHKEAEYFYRNILRGRQFEIPVYIDVEDNRMLGVGYAQLTDIVLAWLEDIASRGYFTGIYSTANVLKNCMDDTKIKRFTHWIACWGSGCNYTDSSC